MKNRRPDLNGVLCVDKPLEWTSADVCRWVRKGTGGAKVGHAGTLDPKATGVLVVCLGSATKLIPMLMDGEKGYRARIDLAHTSPTDDLEAGMTPFEGASPVSLEAIDAALGAFRGTIMQKPPAHSAIWIDGERAYKIARRGEELEMAARPVVIHDLAVVSYAWPILELDIRCGKGTYIRSLARDLGRALGVGGMLVGLRRTAVGAYTIEQAHELAAVDGRIEQLLIPAARRTTALGG